MARKKKVADPVQDTYPSILEELQASAPGGGEPKGKPAVDVDQLLSQIASLTERVERSERTNAALMAQPATYEQPQRSAPQAPAAVELPDPITHPQEYAATVERNVLAKIGQQQYEKNAADSAARFQADRTDALWNTFKETYPELSEDQVLATAAATKVMTDLQKRKGLSQAALERYVYGTPELFLSDVAEKLKKDYGVMFEDGGEPEPTPATRTAVLGGADPLSRPDPAKDAKGQPTFVKDLRDLQREDGYY